MRPVRDDVTALILAGGRATRLGGVDKRELVVDGQTVFERQVAVLAPSVAEIVVSTRREVAGYRCVRDAIEDAGPLAGIAAGLAAVQTEWLLVIAGDMPHLTRELIERMLAATAAETIDAVGIRIAGLPEPLVCVLRVSAALPIVQARLARGELKASRLLDAPLRMHWIEDVDRRALFNINDPADL